METTAQDKPRGEAEVIGPSDTVVLLLNRSKYLFLHPHQRNIRIAKKNYPTSTLIGQQYGTLWQASPHSKTLLPLDKYPELLVAKDVDPTVDNRDLVDDASHQKLTQERILEMKEKGVDGQAIIQALMENSSSFGSKTEFSKEKWIKKKKKKHLNVIKVLKPTAFTVSSAYFSRSAGAINHLRGDSLAQILFMSDVAHNTNVLVLESCKGLITAAVAERVAGMSTVVQIYTEHPVTAAVKLFNFDEAIRRSIVTVPISILKEVPPAAPAPSCPQNSPHSLFVNGFDSLILAPKAAPLPLLSALLVFLKPARPFVVFSPFIEPLAECHNVLKAANQAIQMQLSETWLREFQVLPQRTRPSMSMHGASGYLLTGIKVLPPPVVSSSPRLKKAKIDTSQ